MSSYRPIKLSHDHGSCGHNHAAVVHRAPSDAHDHHADKHDHHHEQAHGQSADAAASSCCGHAPAPTNSCPVTTLDVPTGSVLTQLRIAQMDCPTEEALIRKKLGGMAAISALDFNLMQRLLTVVHRTDARVDVEAAIRSLGMTPEPLNSDAATASKPEQKQPWWPLALAGIAAFSAEVLHWAGLPVWLVALMSLIAVAACGLGTYKKGWIALKNGNLNINALMSIAVTGALLIGQWPEAAMVMFLFTVAELIEAKSLDRARNAVRGLMQLTPERATVQQSDGSWVDIAARSVALDSIVRVKPGERIALDGVLVAGQSTVNQAPITGESLPAEKTVGDSVFAGTINQAGSFDYRVTAAASNSTLARIIHAIEAAQGSRAPTQRFVDQFAKVYTPTVFAIALAVAVLPPLLMAGSWYDWIYKALVLLVIACPCALVISTPVSIVSGLAAAARQGILIKGGAYLEEGCKLKWLALDKTGTITHGKPALTDTVLLEKVAGLDAVQIATSLAARSDHPVSQAIAVAGEQADMKLLAVADFAALLGRGVRGNIGGVDYQLGNHRLIHELGVCSPALEAQLGQLEQAGKTVILLTDGQRVLALFAVADTVKDSSRAAIQSLHTLGIKTVMLTGDNPHTAKAIADQVGIDDALGDQLPEDKLKAIESFSQTGKVGMVGDGINDAPALARADIGFAMGAAGTDTAIETADVALMDDDLGKIARFVRLSQATHAVLVQNIVLALSIKAVFLILTLMGMGTMWMAVFADMGASLLVVGNGLRLLRR
ncbi:heavy metal translocating P-type ATPase [Chitinimonas sp. PSY-7]|uniref:heavy metal translocating P-type ATPase n=1 Tax=Chitinimonas sp. PSY-7 TaxID=3459088 RepID=UPI0040403082